MGMRLDRIARFYVIHNTHTRMHMVGKSYPTTSWHASTKRCLSRGTPQFLLLSQELLKKGL